MAGFHGATLVLTLCSYPYVYLPVLAALTVLRPRRASMALLVLANAIPLAEAITRYR